MKIIAKVVLVGLFFTLFSSQLIGQGYLIIYNLHNDSITWMKDGKLLKEPRLRKNRPVELRLIEYNPFINDIDVEIVETLDASFNANAGAGMAAFQGLLPGLGGMPEVSSEESTRTDQLQQHAPLLDIPLLTINDYPITLRNLFSGSRGGAQALDLATQTMKEIQTIVDEIQNIHARIKSAERAIMVSRLAIENAEKIINHPNIRPSLIKRICTEYYAEIFQKPMGGEVSLDDLLSWLQLPAEQAYLHQQLSTKQKELNPKINLLQSLSDQISSLGLEDPEFRKYNVQLIDFISKTKRIDEQVKTRLSREPSFDNYLNSQQISSLQMKLAEVLTCDFTHYERFNPAADQLTITIRMTRKPDSTGADVVLLKERNIQIESRGGLKFSASVGVNFGQFFDAAQNYSVNNGAIVADVQGAFLPSIVSSLHFYGYRGHRASVGGSFGIGFPVLATDDSQSIQFFIGPSLILGSSQRLFISAGLMGGKVQRLGKGYRVGDLFDANFGDIPTQGQYETGLFFGASFNLGAN